MKLVDFDVMDSCVIDHSVDFDVLSQKREKVEVAPKEEAKEIKRNPMREVVEQIVNI